jgi:hypothetical protein
MRKMPVDKEWQTPRPHDVVANTFANGQYNVGVLLGVHSDWLVDVDLDCPEAVRMASTFLPATDAMFGRYSSRGSHWLYKCTGPVETRKYKDPSLTPDESMMVELRSTGHHTVFPPSTHESGEAIEWSNPDSHDPTEIEPDNLVTACGKLAAAVLCVRAWVGSSGAHHDASLALAGMLHRVGMSDDEVLSFIGTVADAAGDDERADRVRAAKDTLKRAAMKRKYQAATALMEIFGEETVHKIQEFLSKSREGDNIAQFNEEFKFVMLGGKAAVARILDSQDPTDPQDRRVVVFMAVQSFKEYLLNRYITVGKGDAMKTIPFAKYWLETPGVRPTFDRVVFKPGKEGLSTEFNLWRGFSVSPVTKADPSKFSLFMEHLRVNVCDGNEAHMHWVLSWMADIFQRPSRKSGATLVLRGGQGVGKTKIGEVLISLIREHSYQINSAHHLVGKFNAHLQDCLLLVANEAFFAGDKQHENVLKSLITDRTVMVEMKGKDAFEAPNYTRILMTSNEDWVVPRALDDRRFAVFDVGERNRRDRSFFRNLDLQLDIDPYTQTSNGGKEHLLRFLLDYKMDEEFTVRIPETAAGDSQKELSLNPVMKWWRERLTQGDPAPKAGMWARRDEQKFWPAVIAKESLYEDFRHQVNPRWASTFDATKFWVTMWKFLDKDAPSKFCTVRYEQRNADGVISGLKTERLRFMELPTLAAARKRFDRETGMKTVWPEISEEENNMQEGIKRDEY